MPLQYDPAHDPDPAGWLALDESVRTGFVREYHVAHEPPMPKLTVHTALHVIVENQIALGDAMPSRAVLLRLQAEGLDRHDAVHAIGSVLAGHLLGLLAQGKDSTGEANAAYFRELEQLTAEKWRKSMSKR